MCHIFLNRAGQISAACTGADLRRELQGVALRFRVHIPCCASSPSSAPRGTKEHVSLQGHFMESQKGWGWKGPLEMILSNPCAQVGSNSSSRITSSKFPRIMPKWLLIICKDGDVLLSKCPSLQLPLDRCSGSSYQELRVICWNNWLQHLFYKIHQESVKDTAKTGCTVRYRSLIAPPPCCTTRQGWRAMRWFPGTQDWKSAAGTFC